MTRNLQNLPLAINVFGPMVFKKNDKDKVLDLWLPKLGKKHRHQLAIGTYVGSLELGDLSQYSVKAPGPNCHPGSSVHHNPPHNNPCIPYEETPLIFPPSSFFVRITLPRPKWIIGFSPVSCKVYKGPTPPPAYQYRPVGFRLFYGKAGSPVLTSTEDSKFNYQLEFDPRRTNSNFPLDW
jgi:hypothetical protein